MVFRRPRPTPLLVELPYAPGNKEWLRDDRRNIPDWNAQYMYASVHWLAFTLPACGLTEGRIEAMCSRYRSAEEAALRNAFRAPWRFPPPADLRKDVFPGYRAPFSFGGRPSGQAVTRQFRIGRRSPDCSGYYPLGQGRKAHQKHLQRAKRNGSNQASV